MAFEFQIDGERLLLKALARLHDDGDGDSVITSKDLKKPDATNLLKQIKVDNFLEGDLESKAKQLTQYMKEIEFSSRFRSSFLCSKARVTAEGISYYGWRGESVDVTSVREHTAELQNTLSKAFLSTQGKKTVPFNPSNKIEWPKAVHDGKTVKIQQELIREFFSSYDGKTEQMYLLLADRRDGVIKRLLRPRHHEGSSSCGFEDGWTDYISTILKLSASPFMIVGTYHSHPNPPLSEKTLNAGYFPISLNDGDDKPFAEIQLIGHSEMRDKPEKTFQVNAYNDYKNYQLATVRGDKESIFLDKLISKYEPFYRGKSKFTINSSELLELLAGIKLEDYQSQLISKIKEADTIEVEIEYYYDGGFKIIICPKKDSDRWHDTWIEYRYLPNSRAHNAAHGEMVWGSLEASARVNGNGCCIASESLQLFTKRMLTFIKQKVASF